MAYGVWRMAYGVAALRPRPEFQPTSFRGKTVQRSLSFAFNYALYLGATKCRTMRHLRQKLAVNHPDNHRDQHY